MTQGFARPEPLVSTEWLGRRLGEPELRVYDCTVHLLPDPPRISGYEQVPECLQAYF